MERSAFQIIVAEKNCNVREFLRREFIESGYRVLTAKDGFDLVNALRGADKPDLVIMDLDLPYVHGFVTKELCRHQESGLPIVLHGVSDPESDHPLAGGAVAVVEKSGNPKQLEAIVMKILYTRSNGFQNGFAGQNGKMNLKENENSK